MKMKRAKRIVSILIASVLCMSGIFTNITVRGEAKDSKDVLVEQCVLPYYMTEKDFLPMSFGEATISWESDNDELVDVDSGEVEAPESGLVKVNLKATFQFEDLTTKTKDYLVYVMPKGSGYILSYTREVADVKISGSQNDMYASTVTDSMHLGYSEDLEEFEALNHNAGVLYVKNQGSNTKVLKTPYLFRMKDGSFGVLAIRTGVGESKSDKMGEALFFTSEDLISYTEVGSLPLSNNDYVKNPACIYDAAEDVYNIFWTSEDTGTTYRNQTKDFNSIGAKEEFSKTEQGTIESGIEYAIENNVIPVMPEEADHILKRLGTVVNTTVEDGIVVETKKGKRVEPSDIKVKANYSDGSSAYKNVILNEGDIANINFDEPGTYEVSGVVKQISDQLADPSKDNYPFIASRADPNVVKYNGKYYFIATTENSNNVGINIRESDTIIGLRQAKDNLVYSKEKAAEGGITSTAQHWAPELHIVDGKLGMFLANNVSSGFDIQCVYMELQPGGDPKNIKDWDPPRRFLDKNGKNLTTFYGGITLDMTYFTYNDRHYVVWTQRNWGKNGGTSDIWIGEISPDKPYQLISDQVMIAPCEYGWERNSNTPVNEGPFAIITEDTLYLTYSGSATDETYCVGMVSIDLSKDVNFLNKDAWAKTNYPILTGFSVKGYDGPGHNSYVEDEEGNLINVFHARVNSGSGARSTFLRIVHFGMDGFPILDMCEEREILPENKDISITIQVGTEEAFQEIMEKIAAIGETVTLESKDAIKEARKNYDLLTDQQKAKVDNYDDLLEAESAYEELLKAEEDKAAVKLVEYKITSIGTVTKNSKSKIDNARETYDLLTDDLKEKVTNYNVLQTAETTYKELIKEEADQAAAKTVTDKINTIGNVTLESKTIIEEARTAFHELSDAQKNLVVNYLVLQEAEARYKELLKEEADRTAAQAVMDKINAIGTVTIDSKVKVEEAKSAYQALTNEQKKLVTNYEVLQAAETTFATLLKEEADRAAANVPRNDTPAPTSPSMVSVPKKGSTYNVGNYQYKVTKSAKKNGTVQLVKPRKKTFTKLSVPSTVKINGYTFNVTVIASGAFRKYTKLRTIAIGKNVTSIGANAFNGCINLKTIQVNSSKLKKVGSGAFKGTNKKLVVKVPTKRLSSYQKLFKGKGMARTARVRK